MLSMYVCMHETGFSAVTPLLAAVARISVHDFVNWNFFLVLRFIAQIEKVRQLYDYLSEK